MIRLFLIVFLLLITCSCTKADIHNYTDSQADILTIAWKIGHDMGLDNIVQGIAYQESLLGLLKDKKNLHYNSRKKSDRYYGICQLKTYVVKDMDKWYDLKLDLTEEEMIYKLQNDDVFNLYIAGLYLKYLLDYFNKDIDKAILAYNVGMGKVKKNGLKHDPYNYLEKVKAWINVEIFEFNRYHGLTNF